MPKFIPKAKKDDEKKPVVQPPPEENTTTERSEEDLVKLRELERKFGKLGLAETEKESETSPPPPKNEVEPEQSSEQSSGKASLVEHEVVGRVRSGGTISKDDPEYISKEKVESRKRELAMTEARLRSLEREEQDINKRLEYLRREHSAMELAIKEKTHLEREIAELREDRERIKTKVDELKSIEGGLENKTWEELKRMPATGAKISALERRIHELEGQILELNEQRIRAGGTPVEPRKSQPAEVKVDTHTVQPSQEHQEIKSKSEPKKEPEEKKPPSSTTKDKKTRLTF